MTIEYIERNVLPLLSSNKATSIKFIANKLYVSESTARRYLNELARAGLIIRTHGGCMPSAKGNDDNLPMYIRFSSENSIKNNIARKASEFINDGDTVFLDSSSTVFHLIPYLRSKNNLTIVTSGIKTAMSLAELNIKTMCLGGLINQSNLSTNSAYAINLIKQINADIFFFSCDAVNDSGIVSDNSFDECVIRKEFINNSKFKILLVDNSKFNKTCKYNLCTYNEIDKIISNDENDVIFIK